MERATYPVADVSSPHEERAIPFVVFDSVEISAFTPIVYVDAEADDNPEFGAEMLDKAGGRRT
jgi:hypothetical protein